MDANELITQSYTIPTSLAERIKSDAISQDLNASQVVRRILRDFYERKDISESPTPSEKMNSAMPLPVAA